MSSYVYASLEPVEWKRTEDVTTESAESGDRGRTLDEKRLHSSG